MNANIEHPTFNPAHPMPRAARAPRPCRVRRPVPRVGCFTPESIRGSRSSESIRNSSLHP